MQSEQLQNFNERLSQWVASQGFWFQVRYSMASGGTKGVALFHFLRLSFRLLIFLLIVSAGLGVWLVKRTESRGFRQGLETSIGSGCSAEEVKMEGFKRVQGELAIARVVGRGGKGTFFSEVEIRDIKCRMGLLDGLHGVWEPGVISAARLEIDLRAGADDAESSAQIAEAVFREFSKVKVQSMEVSDATLRWGYFERAGRIEGSLLKIQRVEQGWRLNFQGGTFSQSWLRDLPIIDMIVIVTPDGLTFEKAELGEGTASVDFSGLKVEGGERPVVDGVVKVRRMPIERMVPAAASDFVEGSISGDFRASGSTNTGEGIGFEGQVVLDGEDYVTLRDRIHLLRALTVVDVFNNYGRVDFREGSFQLKTGGGQMLLSNLDLVAGDLMTLQGQILARPPTQEEIAKGLATGGAGSLAPVFDPAGGAKDEVYRPEDDPDFTLRKAGKEVNKDRQMKVDDPNLSLFDRIALIADARELQERETERRSRQLQYEGGCRITLRSDAFDSAQLLREMLPVDPSNGRIPMDVPIEGDLFSLTLKQAEELYIRGKR
jgi:hypothetical protein